MKGPDLAHLDIEEVLDLHGWLYTDIIDRMTVYSQVISQLEKIGPIVAAGGHLQQLLGRRATSLSE